MIEGKPFALFSALYHFLGENFVLVVNLREILLGQCIGFPWVTDDRFHRNFIKTKVCDMKYVIREIDIVARIGSPYIVFLVSTLSDEFLELRYDMIIATFSSHGCTKSVMNLFSAIQT